ncbi:hypothetical protein EUTSA_v10002162mg [Eutrema salsugineum]|uniref:S-protein homolog n=1 Tax=Eutrema salsugineum TaxID=72664 RepID=V4MCC1_EUTSA|nr:S-protein homolog 21 [Eutrema salsugineum]ESQ50118.1 hypothetical protein EUTSA_v10002162mg [Eutrema salsugineum]
MKNLTIFLFVFALCMIGNVYGGNPFKGKKTTLLFRNGLAYKKWLKVHCKSKNNDMGAKYLRPGGMDYQFSFHDNVLGGTLFWCTLSKGPDYKISKRFNAYVQGSGGKPHGGSYNYIAQDDGIYHSNLVEFKLRRLYGWN